MDDLVAGLAAVREVRAHDARARQAAALWDTYRDASATAGAIMRDALCAMRRTGMSYTEIAKRTGVKRNTVVSYTRNVEVR